MNDNNLAILLKAAKDAKSDPYVETFREGGFQASCISPLAFRFINANQLQEALRSASEYSCLVLTSQRSIDAISNAFSGELATEWKDVLCHKWRSKPVFVVGQSTCAAASALGLITKGSHTGNADSLSTLIISELKILAEKGQISASTKVLLPCGQLSLETVPNRLSEAGIKTESLTVYETVPDDSLATNVQSFVGQWGKPQYIVFFSPSIVRFSHNVLMDLDCLQHFTRCGVHLLSFKVVGLIFKATVAKQQQRTEVEDKLVYPVWSLVLEFCLQCGPLQLIAIGPTTAAEMTKTLGRVDSIADTPDPQHVCETVTRLSLQI